MVCNKLCLLLLVVAAANAGVINIDNNNNNSDNNNDNGITQYNVQLHAFREDYNDRIDTIDIELEFLVDSLKHAEDRLHALGLLSNSSKECVNKYISKLPSVATTRATVHNCTVRARKQLASLMAAPIATRNNLTYFNNYTLEKEMQKCNNISIFSPDYNTCIQDVINQSVTFATNNKKTFDSQMKAARRSAYRDVRTALHCSFTTQSKVMSVISRTHTLVEKCIQGSDCSPCPGNYCKNVETIPSYMISNKNLTMPNPFYGRNETVSCLMLDIQ